VVGLSRLDGRRRNVSLRYRDCRFDQLGPPDHFDDVIGTGPVLIHTAMVPYGNLGQTTFLICTEVVFYGNPGQITVLINTAMVLYGKLGQTTVLIHTAMVA